MKTISKDEHYFKKIKIIRSELLIWGEQNLRKYPWRETLDPYKIAIAEVMLHRTKADQVKDIYEEFLIKYPDFESIIKAGREAIKDNLKSLGLFWRADLLYDMAVEVIEEYDGKLPLDRKKLMAMPGVGNYISAAILCFGYNLPEPVLDTNTVRVLGRIFGLKITDSSRRSKLFHDVMYDLVHFWDPRTVSFSLIDFANAVCIPGERPRCEICNLRDICKFYLNKRITDSTL
ncbi:HhH-GPD family protein [Methanosarcina mazei]|jgi:A/G-specific adenine glycosylase|uniref:DNA glycosylase n=1 Tax=Methanosarcina mazei TaxID=2209 RepID=A0A0F8N4Z8_METMZ|nr:DNA glycosylase [Methanosarcina mazei]KKG13678.1 DNA glycosylase [Methanosarcina mazei]KKG28513.1 DNA glycosylase [Methanosarcina mazei]KKG40841.1 DNA glycosylase [Methanosarcina mazei]KKG45591.1 DNA glycosylase [Methanosarcina mazei]KKG46796.1 DNA glycosylase [Methanosarcina mazei]